MCAGAATPQCALGDGNRSPPFVRARDKRLSCIAMRGCVGRRTFKPLACGRQANPAAIPMTYAKRPTRRRGGCCGSSAMPVAGAGVRFMTVRYNRGSIAVKPGARWLSKEATLQLDDSKPSDFRRWFVQRKGKCKDPTFSKLDSCRYQRGRPCCAQQRVHTTRVVESRANRVVQRKEAQ